jgi:acyl-coenzyme A thioesterase PaaI-like protein
MFDTTKVLEKAKHSSFYLKLLNWGLYRMVPFNKPHGFRIVEIDDYKIKTLMPYKRSNFNHIKGLHACGLATISEFATGFLLLTSVGQKKYRMILQRLEVNYLYQGKMDAMAEFAISKEWVEAKIATPLKTQDSVVVPCEVKIHDVKGNQLTSAIVHWQFKEWAKVKTKT